MTIVTQLLPDKKNSKQQEPLVQQDELAQATKDVEEGSPVVVTMRSRARRASATTTLCVFITALLVLSTGVIGGVYLYKQFSQYRRRELGMGDQLFTRGSGSWDKYQHNAERFQMKPLDSDDKHQHYRDWCRVSYMPESAMAQMAASNFQKDLDISTQKQMQDLLRDISAAKKLLDPDSLFGPQSFDEEIDIDIEYEQYERIQVPDFSHGRRGRFIHDFSVDKTGIIDLKEQRCFVMPLNRTTVLPPHSLFDLIIKMKEGYYDVDTEVIRETMRVVLPPVTDFSSIGYYIAQECSSLPTYNLEKVSKPVYKRSLNEESKDLFVEFAGNKITELKIVNLEEAVGAKKPSQ